jgi:hypothetical protein
LGGLHSPPIFPAATAGEHFDFQTQTAQNRIHRKNRDKYFNRVPPPDSKPPGHGRILSVLPSVRRGPDQTSQSIDATPKTSAI